MADAWEILFDNSTLGSGHDAWEHLNAQEGGGGGETIIISGAVEAIVAESHVTVTVTSTINVTAEISDPLTVRAANVVSVAVSEENINAGACR